MMKTPPNRFGNPANYKVYPPTNTGLIQPSAKPWGTLRPLNQYNAFLYFWHHLMKWEGGYNLRSPKDDPGGATKYGVTWATLRGAVLRGIVEIEGFNDKTPNTQTAWIPAVKKLTEEQARSIAFKMFWALTQECKNPYCRVIITQVLWGSWLNGLRAATGQGTIKNACLFSTYSAGLMIKEYLNWLSKLPNARSNLGWFGRMYDMLNELEEAKPGFEVNFVSNKAPQGILPRF